VAWRVPHIFTEPLGQILGQVVSCSANSADDGPERGAFLVDLREPIQSRGPRYIFDIYFRWNYVVEAQAKGLIVLLTDGSTIHFSFQTDRYINETSALK
jgi:hypothetical protein